MFSERAFPYLLAAIGWSIWAASFFMPAAVTRYEIQPLVDYTPGWEAAKLSFLTGIGTLPALTNVLMMLSPLALRARGMARLRYALVAWAATVLNLIAPLWLLPPHSSVMYGYWAWLLSFVLLSFSLGIPVPEVLDSSDEALVLPPGPRRS